MRRVIALIVLLSLTSATSQAQELAPKLGWDYEGFSSLSTAAAAARKAKKRLLVGLSGGNT